MLKRYKRKTIRTLAGLIMALLLTVLLVMPALAANGSSDVTVTATGAYVSYTANQTSYAFGTINAGSTTNTTANWVLFTNTSSVSTNISIKMLAAAWTSTGSGWTHSDSAPGVNTVAMKAASGNTTTWQTSVFIKYNAPFNEIGSNIAANSNYTSGLSLLAPTNFTDGATDNNTIRFTYYASS